MRFTSSSNGNGSGNSKTRSHEEGATALRKGPWMAEEDEILLEYVRKHGPRDWSSIRSKGLLPRTGKSCRLRWVNKLKPDLKTGCKFSPEEERIVIELQAQFGNKWARIATYLPGRTDNDVKNFWSTRQKRLARILRTPLQPKSNKVQGKLPVSSHEASTSEDPCLDLILFEDDSSSQGQCSNTAYMDSGDAIELAQMPHQVMSCPCDAPLPLLSPAMDRQPCLLNNPLMPPPPPPPPPPQLRFDHLLQPLLNLPLEPPQGFPVELACQEPSPCIQFPEELPFFGLDNGLNGIKSEHEDPGRPDHSFFDEFPSDMFDFLEQPPPASPKPC